MIDRDMMKQLRQDLDLVVKNIAKQYGFDGKVGAGSFDSFRYSNGSFKIEFALQGKLPEVQRLKNVAPEFQGRTFQAGPGGNSYKIIGMKPRGKSFIIERTYDSKRFTMKKESVQYYIDMEEKSK